MKHFTSLLLFLALSMAIQAQTFVDQSNIPGKDISDWSARKIDYQLPDTFIQHPKILFIGNSFTYYNDMPSIFKGLCIAGGHNVTVTSLTSGSKFLSDFAFTEDNTTLTIQTDSIITTFKPDWTFLQDQSLVMMNIGTRYFSDYAVAAFVEKLAKVKSRPILYMTWPYRAGQSFYSNSFYTEYNTPALMGNAIFDGYLSIARAQQVCLSPAGIAFFDVVKKHPEINMYWPDGTHPSKIGSYLVACCHYATLFRKSPVGLTYNAGIDAQTVAVLQETAARIVLGNTLDLNNLESPVKLELEESPSWAAQTESDVNASGAKALKMLYPSDLTDYPYPIYTSNNFDIVFSKLKAVDVTYKSDGDQKILLQEYRATPSEIYTNIDTLKINNTRGVYLTQRLFPKETTASGVGTLAFKYISGTPTAYYDNVVLHFNENELSGLSSNFLPDFEINYRSTSNGITLMHNANEEVKISIFDTGGRLCRQVNIPENATKFLSLTAGVYLVAAQTSKGSLVKKIHIPSR